jgi:RNA polymerase sigma-70 factor (ECF subfamily)
VKSAHAIRPALRLVEAGEASIPLDLDEVYRDYCRYVAAIILRLCGRRGALEDLIQDVFAEAASGLSSVRQPEAIRGWLATITVRVVRRHLRRQRLYRFLGFDSKVDYEKLADQACSPFDRVLLSRMYQILDELAVDDRMAFILHHVEGETIEVVAELSRVSRNTVKRRILRARIALEERLSDD